MTPFVVLNQLVSSATVVLAQATPPPVAPHSEPEWIWWIVKLGGVAVALGSIYKFVLKPIKKNIIDKFTALVGNINFITAELKPNGGNSLRDKINHVTRLLEKLDQRQLNFFHIHPHGIVETDSKGNLIWANRAYLEITRRHPEEVQGQGWRNCVAEQDRERVVKEWQAAVNDGRDFFTTFHLIDSVGNVHVVETRCLAMRDSSDALLGHLCFLSRLVPPGSR